ncbi:MAG TPA: SDR family NAD(P)-dependent oxidoreductase [Alphaproteobacteria bacterium]
MGGTIAVLGVGASQGLGAGIARRFAREGFRAFIAGRNAGRLAQVAAEISDLGGGEATAVPADVTDRDQVVRFFDAVEEAAGVPDVVAYNAGGNRRIPFLELEPETFTNFWRVCCLGGFLVGQEAARRMLPRGAGTITFTGASASRRGRAGFAAFAAGKAGLKMVAESMAREFGPQGLHVAHVVIDGAIDGERIHQRRPDVAAQRGEGGLLAIDDIAEAFWQIHNQGWTAWTFETELRPYKEPF